MLEQHLIMKMKRTLQEREKQGKAEEEDERKIKALPATRIVAQTNKAVGEVRAALQIVNTLLPCSTLTLQTDRKTKIFPTRKPLWCMTHTHNADAKTRS